jgi:hypothetical protein
MNITNIGSLISVDMMEIGLGFSEVHNDFRNERRFQAKFMSKISAKENVLGP